mgnify:CR=1 FL=1
MTFSSMDDLISQSLDRLEEAMKTFLLKIPNPIYIREKKSKVRFRFTHSSENSSLFQILKLVSIISNLRGCLPLFRMGFIQEIGILFRSINEKLTAIEFVQESHENGNPTAKQQEIIKEFFSY